MRVHSALALLFLATTSSAFSDSHSLRWTEKTVSTLTIKLIDPLRIEYLDFAPRGKVAVTWGTKSVSTNPWLDWKFVDGVVRIYEDGQVAEELTPIRREGAFLFLRMGNGKIGRFKILHGTV
jgi:hypothetical protein